MAGDVLGIGAEAERSFVLPQAQRAGDPGPSFTVAPVLAEVFVRSQKIIVSYLAYPIWEVPAKCIKSRVAHVRKTGDL
jgi:hypothetical protein